MFRKLLLTTAAAIGAISMAQSASAATEMVSSVGVYDWDTLNSTKGSFVATGIIFNGNQVVWCVDLEHDINVTNYNPPLLFTLGTLDFTGGGAPIDEAVSNEIGQIANIGQSDVLANGPDLVNQLEAVQGAIWQLEYGTPFTSGNTDIQNQINQLVTIHDNGAGRAFSLIAHGRVDQSGVQNMVFGGPVPEPSGWALMIGGFGMAGVMLRRRRAAVAV